MTVLYVHYLCSVQHSVLLVQRVRATEEEETTTHILLLCSSVANYRAKYLWTAKVFRKPQKMLRFLEEARVRHTQHMKSRRNDVLLGKPAPAEPYQYLLFPLIFISKGFLWFQWMFPRQMIQKTQHKIIRQIIIKNETR